MVWIGVSKVFSVRAQDVAQLICKIQDIIQAWDCTLCFGLGFQWVGVLCAPLFKGVPIRLAQVGLKPVA